MSLAPTLPFYYSQQVLLRPQKRGPNRSPAPPVARWTWEPGTVAWPSVSNESVFTLVVKMWRGLSSQSWGFSSFISEESQWEWGWRWVRAGEGERRPLVLSAGICTHALPSRWAQARQVTSPLSLNSFLCKMGVIICRFVVGSSEKSMCRAECLLSVYHSDYLWRPSCVDPCSVSRSPGVLALKAGRFKCLGCLFKHQRSTCVYMHVRPLIPWGTVQGQRHKRCLCP